jgi:thioredoxin
MHEQAAIKAKRRYTDFNGQELGLKSNSKKLVCYMSTKKQFGSFEEMLSGSDLPVLVDFYADWCGPCQMMVPILEQVNAQLTGKMKIVKIDTEKYPELATAYEISALPTLVLFKQGKAVDRIEGAMNAPQLVQHLQPML